MILAPDSFVTPGDARRAIAKSGFEWAIMGGEYVAWHPETPGVIWELESRGDFTNASTAKATAHYVWVIQTA